MKIEINIVDWLGKLKTKYKWILSSIAMMWLTAIMAAFGIHEALQIAGAFTAAVFFVLFLLRHMEDNL